MISVSGDVTTAVMSKTAEHDFTTQGGRLRWARMQAGFGSAGPAAEALGVKESTYRAHENGQNEFGYKRAVLYGKAFGVSWAWLLMQSESVDVTETIAGVYKASPGPELYGRNVDFVGPGGVTVELKSKPNASFPPTFKKFPDATVPLLGQTIGGPNGRFILNGQEISRVFCPPDLAGVEGAYAVHVYGTSMEPKFEAGETVWLHPYMPVRSGDYVVAQILSEDGEPPESYIKQFISQSSRVLRLKQLNPEEGEAHEMEFPTERVFSVHKIVFHALV